MIIAIDGFSEADNIKEISRLGIDWIGLDFVADSPRRVRQLASLSGMLPDSPLLECAGLAPGSRLMGVFRDEMPQTIITSIYNFHLDLVRLEGEESTVLIDNLRRTVDPDIRRGLQFVKTLRIERREDLLRAADYAGTGLRAEYESPSDNYSEVSASGANVERSGSTAKVTDAFGNTVEIPADRLCFVLFDENGEIFDGTQFAVDEVKRKAEKLEIVSAEPVKAE